MNNLYVAQVLTGHEAEICAHLQRTGLMAIAPSKVIHEHRREKWRLMRKTVFPGYVFVACEDMTPRLYYAIKRVPYVIRMLGGGTGTPIPEDQRDVVLALYNAGRDFGISTARKVGDKYEIVEGPLSQLADKITHVDARQRKAGMDVMLPGETLRVYVGINVEDAAPEAVQEMPKAQKRTKKEA